MKFIFISKPREATPGQEDTSESASSSSPTDHSSQTSTGNETPTGTARCPVQKECKCNQAGLPLTRQYVKSLIEHLHGQVTKSILILLKYSKVLISQTAVFIQL